MKTASFWQQVWHILPNLLFVPRCAVCGTRLPPGSELPLCPMCRTLYENDKEVTCPVCAGRMGDCLCVPRELPRCGVHRMVKLFRYRPGADDASAKMIYALKHRNLKILQEFFAKELTLPLSGLVEQPGEWVVTYPPRSKSAGRRDGFDHAGALAAALAKQLGCRFTCAFTREDAAKGSEQKRLSRTARFAAARESYTLRPQQGLAGKRVIVVDDVITTGATLAACARLLRREGKAKEVVFAVLAQTPSQKGRV